MSVITGQQPEVTQTRGPAVVITTRTGVRVYGDLDGEARQSEANHGYRFPMIWLSHGYRVTPDGEIIPSPHGGKEGVLVCRVASLRLR